jgi:hypothetical protein
MEGFGAVREGTGVLSKRVPEEDQPYHFGRGGAPGRKDVKLISWRAVSRLVGRGSIETPKRDKFRRWGLNHDC